jgi:hypothetical protein
VLLVRTLVRQQMRHSHAPSFESVASLISNVISVECGVQNKPSPRLSSLLRQWQGLPHSTRCPLSVETDTQRHQVRPHNVIKWDRTPVLRACHASGTRARLCATHEPDAK